MTRNKKIVYYLTLIPLILIIILFSWLFTVIFEGEQPFVKVSPLPQYLSQKQAFQVDIEDTKRGIRALKISYSQGSSEVVLLEMRFPFEGLMNKLIRVSSGLPRAGSILSYRCGITAEGMAVMAT
jgi:uncharacterized membrane protein YkgB